ncbi:hypothetical protein LV164_008686 [Aspergillus fumigatus]|uniref:MADS-box domain-containing protein n=2 Tax=Aspergillus subgen. Fumigati TaxID=2720872 RepID=A0A8H6PEQ5_9EURO|nr:hypothetical protein CNMCM5793_003572 [Aspergillus hiratsukae]KAH1304147.1 hypothetical protein KXX47_008371 [Aspergillus fumigatus]RHZ62829.1 hypothetical protein CDV55_101893 [Aspergillus turcosus]KAH1353546.1 hypothetical protein KXX63_002011 [Aspergillus fumigatus]KAH1372069.1 hypothetical protein KXX50_004474 [Aspergillus fumigatus]
MRVSSKLKKRSSGPGDRTTQEQIRKRRHNLFRRLKEFNDRYDIEIWLTMRMPSGRIYIFATDPNIPAPSEEEIRQHNFPVVHKTPADYLPKGDTRPLLQTPPSLPFLDLPFRRVAHHRSPRFTQGEGSSIVGHSEFGNTKLGLMAREGRATQEVSA